MNPLRLILPLCLILAKVTCEKILFLYPIASPSHKNIAVPLIEGLAERGHNVTVVSSFKTKAHKNIRDIMPFNNFEYFPTLNALELRGQGVAGVLLFDYGQVLGFCEKVYQHQPTMDLLKEKFDVVVVDVFGEECMLGFVHKLGAPLIVVAPWPVPNHAAERVGLRLSPSFVPHFLTLFRHDMTFLQRVENTLMFVAGPWGFGRPIPLHEEIYRRHLGQHVPGVDDILRNTSLILSNSHFSFNFPRPTMPDVVEIGAVHCRPGQQLPKDIDEFLNGGKHGAILFSLGSIVRPQDMPEPTRKAFLNVFSRLKQRVLWKWPLPMSDVPPNVKLLKWVPQQDVLAHPNIRLFITHSGLLSTQESIYHGVPMVSIPVFGDQDLNAKLAADAGIALTVEILNMHEEALKMAINRVLTDNSFAGKVKEMSSYLRDQPQTPKERGVFWIEYVMRHKGAPQLRSAARELNFFQYYCLDVVAVLALIATVLIAAAVVIIRKICNSLLFLLKGKSRKVKVQ